MTFGFFYPTIALPVHFRQAFTENEQQAMLAHELAHLAQRDPCWKLLSEIVRAALWWHPLVWWSKRRLEAAMELAADESSALIANGPQTLAECLVKIGAETLKPRALWGLGIEGGSFRSGLGQRVERLLVLARADAARSPCRPRWLNFFTGSVFILVALFFSIWTAHAVEARITKGENKMQTKSNSGWWHRSLAHLAFAAAVGTTAQAAPPEKAATTAPAPPSTSKQSSSSSENTSELGPKAGNPPVGMSEQMRKRYGLPPGQGGTAPPLVEGGAESPRDAQFGWSVEMYKRYGLPIPPGMGGASLDRAKQDLQSKLESIRLEEVSFDSLPLSEVIKFLIDASTQRDPKGVNFLLNNSLGASPRTAIDPTTGTVIAISPEPVDLSSVVIRISPPLKHIRLIDILDAITKVTKPPIRYTIEPYAVIFSQDLAGFGDAGGSNTAQAPLLTRTFKMDGSSFVKNLERIFGIKGTGPPNRDAIQTLLRQMLDQLGVAMRPPKAIFYNDRNDVVFVRATAEDMELIEAAIMLLAEKEPDANAKAGFGDAPKESNKDAVEDAKSLSSKRMFTVLGEVKKPGNFSIPADQRWTVLQGIAQAEDFTKIANKREIQVRRGEKMIRLNLKQLKETDFLLEPGDVVFVTATFF